MKPKNNKTLVDFIFNQMEKLDNNLIDVDKAKAQASLAKQANNSIKYELDRVNTEIKVRRHNFELNDNLAIRDVEND